MRAFSDLEKQLIHRMIKLDDQSGSLNALSNIIDSFYGKSHLPDHCYISIKSPNDVSIQIRDEELEKKRPDWLRSIDKDISKKLLMIVALFEYLESQKLVYLVGDLNIESLGEAWANTGYTRCEFLDDDLKPLIYKYSRKKIFVSETMRVFVQNQFKTDEEIRHEKEVSSIYKQLKFTRLALGMTIAGLLISILVPIYVTSNIYIKNDSIVTNLDKQTVFEVKEAIEAGTIPLIIELSNTQEKLVEISHMIKQANDDNGIAMQKASQTIGIKIKEFSKSITNSVESLERSMLDSQNKKVYSTTKNGG